MEGFIFGSSALVSFSNCARVMMVWQAAFAEVSVEADAGCAHSPLIVSTAASGATFDADAGGGASGSFSRVIGGRYSGGTFDGTGFSCPQAKLPSNQQKSHK